MDWLAWDEVDDDLVIYGPAPLPAGSFEALLEIYPQVRGAPTWPRWMPRWEFPGPEQEVAARAAIDGILAQAADPELLVAWFGGRGRSFVAARCLSDEDAALARPGSSSERGDLRWFQLLGLRPGQFKTSHRPPHCSESRMPWV